LPPPRPRLSWPAAVWAAVLPHPPFNDQATMGTAAINGPARLAAYLNGRPVIPPLAVSCPALLASYQVSFIPKQGGGAAVTAEPGCLADRIDVNDVPQPLVWDSGGRLADMIRGLLGRR
jgi:hypothetical protein